MVRRESWGLGLFASKKKEAVGVYSIKLLNYYYRIGNLNGKYR